MFPELFHHSSWQFFLHCVIDTFQFSSKQEVKYLALLNGTHLAWYCHSAILFFSHSTHYEVVKPWPYPAFGMCLEDIHIKWIVTLKSKQPVDGVRPYSSSARTDEHYAQCRVCFLRAAGGNVSRGPWLGEAGCPGFLRSSLALGSVFFCPPLPLPGASETHSPLRLLALSSAPIQEVAEPLMCRQKRFSEAKTAQDHLLNRIQCMKVMDDFLFSLSSQSPAFIHHESVCQELCFKNSISITTRLCLPKV